MFDNEEEQDIRSEFEEWMDINFFLLPVPFRFGQEPEYELYSFYTGIYKKVMRELWKPVREITRRHYPEVMEEERPLVVERIERILNFVGHRFLLNLFELLYDQRCGVDLREKYPDFDKYKMNYAKPQRQNFHDDSFFDDKPWITEEQKEILKQCFEEDAPQISFKEMRKIEFVDMLQSVLLKHFDVADRLEPDSLIIYAMYLACEHMDFRLDIEHYSTFIQYGFDESELDLSYEEFMERLSKKISQKLNR
ncbi:MAG: hypothetical protein Q8909_14270 [Bacteroidota bacterium]|nr:hypothetical protein [Bacteroidota bacterium]